MSTEGSIKINSGHYQPTCDICIAHRSHLAQSGDCVCAYVGRGVNVLRYAADDCQALHEIPAEPVYGSTAKIGSPCKGHDVEELSTWAEEARSKKCSICGWTVAEVIADKNGVAKTD